MRALKAILPKGHVQYLRTTRSPFTTQLMPPTISSPLLTPALTPFADAGLVFACPHLRFRHGQPALAPQFTCCSAFPHSRPGGAFRLRIASSPLALVVGVRRFSPYRWLDPLSSSSLPGLRRATAVARGMPSSGRLRFHSTHCCQSTFQFA